MKNPFRSYRQDTPNPKLEMATAITDVLTRHGAYYDDLSEDELFGYVQVLWDYHNDLRDEWTRREMHEAAKKHE